MGKVIKYNLYTRINRGTNELPVWEDVLTPVEMGWSEANESIAKLEAYNGVYNIDVAEDESSPLTVEERLTALESVIVADDYVPGTWYYRGDRITFNESVFVCIAPVGVVCVWNPEEYSAYWKKV